MDGTAFAFCEDLNFQQPQEDCDVVFIIVGRLVFYFSAAQNNEPNGYQEFIRFQPLSALWQVLVDYIWIYSAGQRIARSMDDRKLVAVLLVLFFQLTVLEECGATYFGQEGDPV